MASKSKNHPEKNRKPNLIEVIGSILAAIFGIQENWRRERDFKHGNPTIFIIAGVVTTIVILLILFMIVKVVLYNAHVT